MSIEADSIRQEMRDKDPTLRFMGLAIVQRQQALDAVGKEFVRQNMGPRKSKMRRRYGTLLRELEFLKQARQMVADTNGETHAEIIEREMKR